jgi:hypothetical protein
MGAGLLTQRSWALAQLQCRAKQSQHPCRFAATLLQYLSGCCLWTPCSAFVVNCHRHIPNPRFRRSASVIVVPQANPPSTSTRPPARPPLSDRCYISLLRQQRRHALAKAGARLRRHRVAAQVQVEQRPAQHRRLDGALLQQRSSR